MGTKRGNDVAGVSPSPVLGDRSGLPGWAYHSQELFELECRELFATHWQYVCHVSEVAETGAFRTLDMGGERGVVIRGNDGTLRGFHNLCRHRGSRLFTTGKGRCKGPLVCPYHGWSYNNDGTLRGVARPETFPELDRNRWGMIPLDTEIWNGLVFIRFQTGPQPSVAELFGRHRDEIEPYRLKDMKLARRGLWHEPIQANWKAVRDVDNEGYHVPQAHPALQDLYGMHYHDDPYIEGTSRSLGSFNEGPGRFWSVRNYKTVLPEAGHLPRPLRTAWLYIGLFPNFVLGFYPDSVIYYREIPVSATETVQNGGVFRYRSESRELKLARYLSGRIDRETSEEDRMLTIWASEAVNSSAYDGIILSDLEIGLKTHHDDLRNILPVLRLDMEPEPGTMATRNRRLPN